MRGQRTENENNSLIFISFMQGEFVQRVNKDTPGAVSRELTKGDNAGKLVYELRFDTVEGQILECKTKDSQFGKRLLIMVDVTNPEEPEKILQIELPLSSSAAKGFLKRVPNIKLADDVVLKGYYIERSDKPGQFGSYLVPYQDGKIEPAFTKEAPNGLPEMEQIKVSGKMQWDDTKQLEFFEQLIAKTFKPQQQAETPAEIDEDKIAF